jgi:hypothetical protein
MGSTLTSFSASVVLFSVFFLVFACLKESLLFVEAFNKGNELY